MKFKQIDNIFLKKQSLLSYLTFGYYAIKFQQEDLNQKPDQISNFYDKQIKVENQIDKKLNNDESSFYYKVLVKRRDDLEQKLAVMYNMPTSETTAGAAVHM